MKVIRIGVVGAGSHSSNNHGPALKQYCAEHPGEIELTAICDLDRDKAQTYADAFGFARVYDDVGRMLAGDTLDGLVLITPVAVTREVVGELLSRGIPLLIEKPPGENSAQTRELLRIARETGTPHMISFNRRFHPAVARAREWLAAHAADRPPDLALARMQRVGRRETDFITATAIHSVDAVLSFMSAP